MRSTSEAGVFAEALREGGGAAAVLGDDQNRVIAGDRADGLGRTRAVDGHGERLRLAGAGADDDQLLHAIDLPQVFTGGALERFPHGVGVERFDARPLIGAVAGALDQAELLDIERDRRLHRLETGLR